MNLLHFAVLVCAVQADQPSQSLIEALEAPEFGVKHFERMDNNTDSFLDIQELHEASEAA